MASRKKPVTPAPSGDFDALVASITATMAPLQTLHQQAVEAIAPTVHEILRSRSQDTRLIEHTLDHLLDHACIPQGLACFKSLCRHYWQINPEATAEYIGAYREMWDAESDDGHETMDEGSRLGTSPTENAAAVSLGPTFEGELNLLAHAGKLRGLGYGG